MRIDKKINTKEFRQCLENIAIHFFTLWKLYIYVQALYTIESCIYMNKHFTLWKLYLYVQVHSYS